MWKLGLNKAPVGQIPEERAILRNELVQLELREGNATTHTRQLLIIQLSYYITTIQTGMMGKIIVIFCYIKLMIIFRQYGCLITAKHLFFYLQLIDSVL